MAKTRSQTGAASQASNQPTDNELKKRSVGKRRKGSNDKPSESQTEQNKEVIVISSLLQAFGDADCEEELYCCRDAEKQKVEKFISECLRNRISGAMYIFGKPGTGKTCCVNFVVNKLPSRLRKNVHQINAVSLNKDSSPGQCSLFVCIATMMGMIGDVFDKVQQSQKWRDNATCVDLILGWINGMSSKSSRLIIVDEADKLVSSNGSDSMLSHLFRLATNSKNAIGVIAISNSVQHLRHSSSEAISMETLLFEPYTAKQLMTIIQMRFDKSCVKNGVIRSVHDSIATPKAIQLCSARAAKEGDCRLFLNLWRTTLAFKVAELTSKQPSTPRRPPKQLESPEKRSRLAVRAKATTSESTVASTQDDENMGESPERSLLDKLGELTLCSPTKQLSAIQISDLTSVAKWGQRDNLVQKRISSLPLHQLLTLCACCHALDKRDMADIFQIESCYHLLCTKCCCKAMTEEFVDNLEALHASGFVEFGKGKKRSGVGKKMVLLVIGRAEVLANPKASALLL